MSFYLKRCLFTCFAKGKDIFLHKNMSFYTSFYIETVRRIVSNTTLFPSQACLAQVETSARGSCLSSSHPPNSQSPSAQNKSK